MKRCLWLVIGAVAAGLLTGPVAAQDNPLNELGTFFANYYRNPEPDRVVGLLKTVVEQDIFNREELQQNDAVYTLAYSFGRIGQLNPKLVEQYKAVFKEAPAAAKNFLARILMLSRAPDVLDFLRLNLPEEEPFRGQILATLTDEKWLTYDPLTKKVEHPTDLDMLWSEFMTTGNEAAVVKIIDAMAWPDVMRERINGYLSGDAPPEEKEQMRQLLRENMNIRIDPQTGTVSNQEDIDYLFMVLVRSRRLAPAVVRELRETLEITEEEFFIMATKGSAVWSVGSNAAQHEKVLQICMREAKRREGSVRVGLLQAVGMPLMAQRRFDEAYPYMDELTRLTPDDPRPQYSKARILLAQKDLPAFQEQVALMQERDVPGAAELLPRVRYLELDLLDADAPAATLGEDIADTEGLLEKVSAAMAGVTDYRTHMLFDGANDRVIEWEAEVGLPDRFSVMQSAVRDGQSMFDRWLTVGDDTFIKIGQWIKMPGDRDTHGPANDLLRADKWMALLRANGIDRARRVQIDNGSYLVLTVTAENMDGLTLFDEETDVTVTSPAELWLEPDTHRLLKAGININIRNPDGEATDMTVKQFFDAYDAGVDIERPEEFMDASKGGNGETPTMP